MNYALREIELVPKSWISAQRFMATNQQNCGAETIMEGVCAQTGLGTSLNQLHQQTMQIYEIQRNKTISRINCECLQRRCATSQEDTIRSFVGFKFDVTHSNR